MSDQPTNRDSGPTNDSPAALPLWDVFRGGLVVSLPAAIALAVITGFDAVEPVHAAGAWCLSLLISMAIVRRHYSLLDAIKRHIQRRAGSNEPERASKTGDVLSNIADGIGETAELASALTRLFRGISDRRGQLQALNERHVSIIDNIPDPLIFLNQKGRVQSMNRAARDQFGGRIMGRELSQVARDPALLEAGNAVLSEGGFRTVEISISDPVNRIFNVRIEALPGEQDEQRSALVIFRDLTEIRRIESMRVDFVANVSHELRTPLATLHGFIETLRGPAREDIEAHERFLEIMEQQTSRMTRLVTDLLSLSRIEAAEHTAPDHEVELRPLVEHIAAATELGSARRGIRIAVDIDPNLPPLVANSDEISQVLQNLVENAVKYGRDQSTVTISARVAADLPASVSLAAEDVAAISVSDQGDGIPREHIPRLTERFYRVDTARSRELGGTGLGLAIVKHIVSRHRGALSIESKVGEGSTFTVFLPCKAGDVIKPQHFAVG
ncbi:ATP-binding protein [Nisaea acidiphila]|uniref:histidine kinase n=1 Tax=Nisaea acidiphila TaxID=1862145 RepID=A0A9J7B0Z3_9PROT|nr:ATP-binding protein [Nisaea acidiphila]UUX52140.1 ATP-binding protein [Nisaea acidiphila]